MPEFLDPVELFWDHLLSREPDQILAAVHALDEETRQRVIAHLQSMASEEGWHPEQRKSAQVALEVISGEQSD